MHPPTFTGFQDRLANLLGCEPERRSRIVQDMIHRSPREATGYWLQLVIAMGIATMGLVLDSTAVIIGAMLVAPLMGPIVGMGMGLATGSPILTLRASARVVSSVALVVGLSAALVRALPFRELTSEISARTTPTVLDLATAMFCAMAGVYATLRPSSDVATTAAGTSIGISLVPPLCVAGYGLGTGAWRIARGAGLLFMTNVSAIVIVGTLAFALSGFGKVDTSTLEDEEHDKNPGGVLARPLVRRVLSRLRSVGGPWLRLLMPLALLAAIQSPLRTGLDQVASQIAARDAVDRAIDALPQRVVQAKVRVEPGDIELAIFLLGSPADARAARASIAEAIANETHVTPRVEVHAVTDASEFEALERATEKPTPIPAPREAAPPPPPTPKESIEASRAVVRTSVERRWPGGTAGALLRVDIGTAIDGVELRTLHMGPPLDPAAHEVLERTLADDLGLPVQLLDDAIPGDAVPLERADDPRIDSLVRALERSRVSAHVRLCVRTPGSAAHKPKSKDVEALVARLRAALGASSNVEWLAGDRFEAQFSSGACPTPP